MAAATAALLAVLAVGGLVLAVLGFLPADPSTGRQPAYLSRLRILHKRAPLTKRRLLWLTAAIAGAVVAYMVTGWLVALVAVPVAVYGLPILLAAPPSAQTIGRMEALEFWTRSLSGLIVSGAGLEQALSVSLSGTPEPIKREVTTLVARLNARWTTYNALQAFANDLKDPTVDLVVAHLLLAAKQRGAGLAAALDDLAQIVFEEVKTRREIEADRAKPRANARMITIISVAVLVAAATVGAQYMAPYATASGQLILALLLGAYVAALLWMRRMSMGKSTPRILVDNTVGKR